jgi:hypothetical protein
MNSNQQQLTPDSAGMTSTSRNRKRLRGNPPRPKIRAIDGTMGNHGEPEIMESTIY